MDEVLTAAVAGLAAGLGVAMPLGAIGVLIVHEGMSGGWRPAATAATGVALVDVGYSALAVAAGAGLGRALDGWQHTIHRAGAGLLVVIAARGLAGLARAGSEQGPGRVDPVPNAGLSEVDVLATGAEAQRTAWRVGARFVGLTAVNPLTAVYFVALAAGLGAALSGWQRAAAFVAAVFVASLAWQLMLATFGAMAGARLPASARRVTGALGYLVVLGYAARLALT